MDISIVVPLLNESESLAELTERVAKEINDLNKSFEIVFIDDGSTDGSLDILRKLKKQYPQIRVISFSRNFGKSAALSEGFRIARGEIVITMDADLQDDPTEIPKLIHEIESGFDLVSGWKQERHDPINKTIPSKFFNFITRQLTGIKIHDFNCGLKAYRSRVIKAIPVYGELHRYLPVLAHWLGYKVGELVVKHHPRKFGYSKFGIKRFFNGFFDLLTVLFITRYRQKPLHLFGFMGLGSSFLGGIILLYLSILWFQGHGIGQRPLFFLGVLLMIVGVQFFSIGLIGEMLINTRDNSVEYTIKDKID
ncbi:MAG: glycosyltransferase family 2 protein [Calditrichae bacterium]|nr:glycosyltransferase family 2 protein [Calditrichota bacterium]MCB9059576.1 glycosyltransferase family 2 protein [Calditrichia bacterium]